MNRNDERLSTADFVATREPVARQEAEPEETRGQTAGAKMQPEETNAPLLPPDAVQDLRGKWDQVQTGFVDEPRESVKRADELVATTMKRLAESFTEQRNALEQQWGRGGDVSTEDLRLALRKYRSFFQRLLAV